MYIIPAIDLIEGKCVRLIQGRYDRRINYQSDPVKQAEDFIADGAQWLHIVDLEGAKAGRPVNTEAISAIAELGKLKIEVGGGLRDETSIQQLFVIGVERAIIGTKAVSDFEWFSQMAEKFSGKIVLGLDSRGSKVSTEGWLEDSSESLLEFATKAARLPLAAIIYTDIAKDGMMEGPNLERTHKECRPNRCRSGNNRPKLIRRQTHTCRCHKSSKSVKFSCGRHDHGHPRNRSGG
jgi:phosphoribosylformimino-5-aminoimidazole carboxamide ribotide isomerase